MNQHGTFITFCFSFVFGVTRSCRVSYHTFPRSNFHHILFYRGYPEVEVIEVEVEKGFAVSGGSTNESWNEGNVVPLG